MSGIHQALLASTSIVIISGGQALYSTAGTYSWVCPAGVTSVCVVAIAGGGGGQEYNSGATEDYAMNGGAGAELRWKNNIAVTPGVSYTVVVGEGGLWKPYNAIGDTGGFSRFKDISTVNANGGQGGLYNDNAAGGNGGVGDGGGNGGDVTNPPAPSGWGGTGGGGTGGYSGKGGDGSYYAETLSNLEDGDGGGGSGGNANSTEDQSYGGGGTGPLGEGVSGLATQGEAGKGGSGGDDGSNAADRPNGGWPGGGGGGSSHGSVNGRLAGSGADGAVRIIWGAGRAFPSTNTGDT